MLHKKNKDERKIDDIQYPQLSGSSKKKIFSFLYREVIPPKVILEQDADSTPLGNS